ncbi:importin beta-1 subunit [Perkinsela sp. CCAP 1560/4]|nr:importin beta-1 subunit [Perkinsela sp. CCAP 1560/4]|eukprot:KNH06325.1 importin beta-1 subunit [Perkinsela sp. CCAP 1560/4]
MSRVVDLLVNLGSQDAHVRRGAEEVINKARDENIGTFLMELIYVVRDESIGSAPRQQALILLKNTVAFDAKEDENKRLLKARWSSVGPEMKMTIRRELLNTLGSVDRSVRHIAALVISNLARLELPVNQWPDLLNGLYGACQIEKFQEAAIITLGYICEESATCAPLEMYLQEHCSKILECVISGMQKSDPEICYQATQALYGSISFIHPNMKIDDQRDYILKSVFNNCMHRERRICVKALECITRIAFEYYSILGSYMHILLELTVQAIKSEDEDQRVQGFMFWTSICEVEIELQMEGQSDDIQRFAGQSAARVIPLCLNALLSQEEDRAEDEWDTFAAGGVCLQSYAQAMQGEVIQHVVSFITTNINEADWRKKDAAISAFGAIIEGPSADHLGNIIMQAFPALLNFTTSQHHKSVRLSSVWCISQIANFHASLILNSFLHQTIHTAACLLQEGSVIGSKACAIIHNLCQECVDSQNPDDGVQATNVMSKYFDSLVRVILVAIDDRNNDEHNLSGAAQETLNSLLSCAAKDVYPSIHGLIPESLLRIKANVDIVAGAAADGQAVQRAHLMLGLMCGTIQNISQKLGDELTPDEGNSLMNALFSVVRSHGGLLQGEPILAMGAVASALKGSFVQYLPEGSRYLFESLKVLNDEHLFKRTLGMASDLCFSLNDALPAEFCDTLIFTLLGVMQNEELPQISKVHTLSCLGDVAFIIGARFEKYIAPVMNAIETAAASVKDVSPENYEMLDFRDGLVEASCEVFTGIIQGLVEHHDRLIPHVSRIAAFIGEFGTKEGMPEKCTEQCVVVLGDTLAVFKSARRLDTVLHELKAFIHDQRMTAMIQRAKHSDNESLRSFAQWTQEQMVEFLKNYMNLTGTGH